MTRTALVYGASIIEEYGLSEACLLGAGYEARVYALDAQRVLKIHVAGTTRSKLDNQKEFYDKIISTPSQLLFPKILEIHAKDGHFFTIEKRIPGANMAGVLQSLQGARREALLASYVETSGALRDVRYDALFFGEIMADDPIHTNSWSEFLVRRIRKTLETSGPHLAEDVPDFGKIAAKWYSAVRNMPELENASLVHGDFYPDNLMVDTERCKVTALIDFSTMALAGDWRLDVVGAQAFLSAPDDLKFVETAVARSYPEITPEIFGLYKTYYAFYFSPAKIENPKFYRWCVAAIHDFGAAIDRPAHGSGQDALGP